MNRLKLILPTPEYKEKIMDYKREFIENGDSMDGTAGMTDIRHRLNDYLLNFGGHIGYSVRKSERQKRYATEMLALALIECEKLNIKKVLITCDKDNVASAKAMINNGAKLDNEIPEGNRITQKYWITLKY